MNRARLVWVAAIGIALCITAVQADPLSIYDVQYTEDPDGISAYNGQTWDVSGGVVTYAQASGSRRRVYIQDPAHLEWGGILIKDWTGGGLADHVAVGDRIDVSSVYVEESSGTTTLQYGGPSAGSATFQNLGPASSLPEPLDTIAPAILAAPVYTAGSPDTWLIEDYDAEPYEGMLVTFTDVTVGQVGLGAKNDIYQLLVGDDVLWCTDYMNLNKEGDYHPRIFPGAQLRSYTGIVEHYIGTNSQTGAEYDCYQVCTRWTADIVPEPGTFGILIMGLLLMRRPRP